ncbi:unnamed protein product, partial [Rotaria sordida]
MEEAGAFKTQILSSPPHLRLINDRHLADILREGRLSTLAGIGPYHNILEKGTSEALTNHSKALGKLPDFGSLAMSKCVLAALKDCNCGADLISLSSILSVLNTTTLLKSIPQNYKSPGGDFMTLLNVMEEILVVKQSVSTKEFSLDRICQAKGLSNI